MLRVACRADVRVAAWSSLGVLDDRAFWLRARLYLAGLDLKMLRRNQDLSPLHPGPIGLMGAGIQLADLSYDDLVAWDLAPAVQRLLDGVCE